MRPFLLLAILLFLLPPGIVANNDPGFDEEAVIKRLDQMKNEVVKPRYDRIVRSYLRTYFVLKRDKAAEILGRKVLYFPMIEEYLEQYKLPNDLKYLPVVESALEISAVSRSQAKGLWQFMAPTGRYFGLEINDEIDERLDPQKSTRAAMEYLTRLYERFNDWELAIAAYNSGGGRVSRAMKRARSSNYWTVRRYLPRETANYVPAFIAAHYLLEHYEAHQLEPVYPSLDEQITETIKVYQGLTFAEVSYVCDVPMDLMEQLNPAYHNGTIPSNRDGNYLTLPRRYMNLLKQHLDGQRPDYAHQPMVEAAVVVENPRRKSDIPSSYVQRNIVVQGGQTLDDIAQIYGCTRYQIMAWNKMSETTLRPGQELRIFAPKTRAMQTRERMVAVPGMLPVHSPSRLTPQPAPASAAEWQYLEAERYIYYQVLDKERVEDLAESIPGISVERLMRLNDFRRARQKVRPGDLIRLDLL